EGKLRCVSNVGLQETFGRMTACSSPSEMLNVRSSVATMPPKRFARLSTRSKSAMARLPEQTVDSASRKENHQKQQRTEDDLPIFGNAREHLLQHEQRHRSKQWTEG